ncbi:MAG TPA: hypothetical protein V6C88_10215 [Chroococcidiopsis sp.]
MAKHVLQQWSIAFQAKLGLWLTSTFSDAHDATIYDSPIQKALTEQGIAYDNYALAPGFDYQNEDAPQWKVLVLSAGQWNAIMLPNPFHLAATYSQAVVQDSDVQPVMLQDRGEQPNVEQGYNAGSLNHSITVF